MARPFWKVKQATEIWASSLEKADDIKSLEGYPVSVKVPTQDQQRLWLDQYKAAAIELEKQRWHELRTLTDLQALAMTDVLLSMPVTNYRRETSGLVEQQEIFKRAVKS